MELKGGLVGWMIDCVVLRVCGLAWVFDVCLGCEVSEGESEESGCVIVLGSVSGWSQRYLWGCFGNEFGCFWLAFFGIY